MNKRNVVKFFQNGNFETGTILLSLFRNNGINGIGEILNNYLVLFPNIQSLIYKL